MPSPGLSLLERCAVVMLGLYLAAVGIHMMIGGHMLYRNYLRTPVLAPVALAIGVALMIAGLWMRS